MTIQKVKINDKSYYLCDEVDDILHLGYGTPFFFHARVTSSGKFEDTNGDLIIFRTRLPKYFSSKTFTYNEYIILVIGLEECYDSRPHNLTIKCRERILIKNISQNQFFVDNLDEILSNLD